MEHLTKDTRRTEPREYCAECRRVTGTDLTTGKCGGCIMHLILKDTKKRTAERQEEHKATDWEDVAIIVAISTFLAYLIIRSMF